MWATKPTKLCQKLVQVCVDQLVPVQDILPDSLCPLGFFRLQMVLLLGFVLQFVDEMNAADEGDDGKHKK